MTPSDSVHSFTTFPSIPLLKTIHSNSSESFQLEFQQLLKLKFSSCSFSSQLHILNILHSSKLYKKLVLELFSMLFIQIPFINQVAVKDSIGNVPNVRNVKDYTVWLEFLESELKIPNTTILFSSYFVISLDLICLLFLSSSFLMKRLIFMQEMTTDLESMEYEEIEWKEIQLIRLILERNVNLTLVPLAIMIAPILVYFNPLLKNNSIMHAFKVRVTMYE